jgi:hypothetical protein
MLNTGLQPRTERSEAPRGCNSTRQFALADGC